MTCDHERSEREVPGRSSIPARAEGDLTTIAGLLFWCALGETIRFRRDFRTPHIVDQ